jgi:hypothetical protein
MPTTELQLNTITPKTAKSLAGGVMLPSLSPLSGKAVSLERSSSQDFTCLQQAFVTCPHPKFTRKGQCTTAMSVSVGFFVHHTNLVSNPESVVRMLQVGGAGCPPLL